MATIIDSLIVEFGIDAKKLIDGQKKIGESLDKTGQASAKSSKDLELQAKRAADGFKKVRNEVLALAAAIFGISSIKSFSSQLTDSDAKIGRFATNINGSVSEINALNGAVKRAGGTSEGMTRTLQNMNDQIQSLAIGGTPGEDVFRGLSMAGIAVDKYFDKSTGYAEKLKMLADAGEKMNNPAKEQALFRMAGIDEGTVQLLMKGRAGIEALMADQRKYNNLTEEQTRLSIEWNNAWLDIRDTAHGFGRELEYAVVPILIPMLKEFGAWIQSHKADIERVFVTDIKALGNWLKGVDWSNVEKGLERLIVRIERIVELIANSGVGGWVDSVTGGSTGTSLDDKLKRQREEIDKQTGNSETRGLWNGTSKLSQTYRKNIAAGAISSTEFGNSPLAKLIGSGEGGYNSINLGSKHDYKSSNADLMGMTIQDVMNAQERGDFNAAGRYQIIKGTLKEAVAALGINKNDKFDAAMQDRIVKDYIIRTKRPGMYAYLTGQSDNLREAGKEGAQEWASVANPETGRSFYGGVNKSSISSGEFGNAMLASRSLWMRAGDSVQSSSIANTSSAQTTIGQVTINTQATDGPGIAKSFNDNIQRYSLVNQSNSGIQ